jgi:hypothetical protein
MTKKTVPARIAGIDVKNRPVSAAISKRSSKLTPAKIIERTKNARPSRTKIVSKGSLSAILDPKPQENGQAANYNIHIGETKGSSIGDIYNSPDESQADCSAIAPDGYIGLVRKTQICVHYSSSHDVEICFHFGTSANGGARVVKSLPRTNSGKATIELAREDGYIPHHERWLDIRSPDFFDNIYFRVWRKNQRYSFRGSGYSMNPYFRLFELEVVLNNSTVFYKDYNGKIISLDNPMKLDLEKYRTTTFFQRLPLLNINYDDIRIPTNRIVRIAASEFGKAWNTKYRHPWNNLDFRGRVAAHWCSEFARWVFMQAGIRNLPFPSEDDGGWKRCSNISTRTMRDFFRENGKWAAGNEGNARYSKLPSLVGPGDYVSINGGSHAVIFVQWKNFDPLNGMSTFYSIGGSEGGRVDPGWVTIFDGVGNTPGGNSIWWQGYSSGAANLEGFGNASDLA